MRRHPRRLESLEQYYHAQIPSRIHKMAPTDSRSSMLSEAQVPGNRIQTQQDESRRRGPHLINLSPAIWTKYQYLLPISHIHDSVGTYASQVIQEAPPGGLPPASAQLCITHLYHLTSVP